MRGMLAVAVLGLCACAQAGRGQAVQPLLLEEGELVVWLDPLPHESHRLGFDLRGLAAVREGGEAVPLGLRHAEVTPSGDRRGQRLLAAGRVPPGRYVGLRLTVGSARLAGADGPAALLVGAEPADVELHADVRRGRATVVALRLDPAGSLADGFAFTPRFSAVTPGPTPPGLVGACTAAAGHRLLLFDTRTRTVDAVVATGLAPQGLALDPIDNRAYLALSGQDQVEVVDLAAREPVASLRLRAGDEPRALLLLPDRRTLFVANARSRSGAFLDLASGQELARVALGEGAWSAVQHRPSHRAWVVNRRSSTLTAVDLANRQVTGTVPTEPEPLFARVSRDGTRLWLVHAGSFNLVEYALPGLSVTRRLRVGLGVSALQHDPRTGLLYVARADAGRVEVYDPAAGLPVDGFDLPAPAAQLVIDDVQGQLWAVLPSRRELAVVDLTSRRVLAAVELPDAPSELRLAAERE